MTKDEQQITDYVKAKRGGATLLQIAKKIEKTENATGKIVKEMQQKGLILAAPEKKGNAFIWKVPAKPTNRPQWALGRKTQHLNDINWIK